MLPLFGVSLLTHIAVRILCHIEFAVRRRKPRRRLLLFRFAVRPHPVICVAECIGVGHGKMLKSM